ncbi:unnamed protein product [Ixodes pacificus]
MLRHSQRQLAKVKKKLCTQWQEIFDTTELPHQCSNHACKKTIPMTRMFLQINSLEPTGHRRLQDCREHSEPKVEKCLRMHPYYKLYIGRYQHSARATAVQASTNRSSIDRLANL